MAELKLSLRDTKIREIQQSVEIIIENKMKAMQQGILSAMDNKMQAMLEKLEKKLENSVEVQNGLASKFQDLQESLSSLKNFTKPIPPKFEQIGERYFYIEHKSKQNWFAAANTCRQMGGHLASGRNEKEVRLIMKKLHVNGDYWLGVNNLANQGDFVNLGSGISIYFDEIIPNFRCLSLSIRDWHTKDCYDNKHFICQADEI
ncbi:C-type lectin 37Db-like [Drosophila elegans]|uniref:C-type lectin 37Db-like n=1 Tax=Drosophila elegans TaxID=30023 RepID=UPI0007E5EF87|nr:C-type lectin 37Db-like [Drosophila elegans]